MCFLIQILQNCTSNREGGFGAGDWRPRMQVGEAAAADRTVGGSGGGGGSGGEGFLAGVRGKGCLILAPV